MDGVERLWFLPIRLARLCWERPLAYCHEAAVLIKSSAERYDPSTNVWTVIGSMTTARKNHGVIVLGGFIHAIGGLDVTKVLSTVERYDPSTDVWMAIGSMTTARHGHGVVTL